MIKEGLTGLCARTKVCVLDLMKDWNFRLKFLSVIVTKIDYYSDFQRSQIGHILSKESALNIGSNGLLNLMGNIFKK